MKERVLITGCCGFLASYLIEQLASENVQLSGITNREDFSCNRLDHHLVDIRDRESVEKVFSKVKPDRIFHLAAVSNVGLSWKNPDLTYGVNLIGSANVMDAAAKFSSNPVVVLMSSAELYGNMDAGTSEVSVNSPYALSKYAMELHGDMLARSGAIRLVKMRSFNFTGPGQDQVFVSSDFARQIVEIEKDIKDPVIYVGNLNAVRDFSDVRDIARYVDLISSQHSSDEVFDTPVNLCSGKSRSIRDILDIMLGMSNRKIEIIVDKSRYRPIDTKALFCDPMVLKGKFGLKPQYQMEETLEELLNYWRKRVTGS